MFGIGHGPEIIILLVIVLLVFGPGKLPEVGSAIGRGIREFRDATNGRDDRPAPMINQAPPPPPVQQWAPPAQQYAPPAQQYAPPAEQRQPVSTEPSGNDR